MDLAHIKLPVLVHLRIHVENSDKDLPTLLPLTVPFTALVSVNQLQASLVAVLIILHLCSKEAQCLKELL
jgi:hypothetical protein